MKSYILLTTFFSTQLLLAQGQEQPKERPEAQQREQIIKRFDKDGDGKLSPEEAANARRALAARPAQTDRDSQYKQTFSIRDPKDFKIEGEKEIFSGPQAGERLPKLAVSAVGGDQDGKTINALGENTGAQLIIMSDQYGSSVRGLIGLLRFVSTINEKSEKKLNATVVYLGDDKNKLNENARRYGQYIAGKPTIGISNDGRDGPGSYGLNRNVSMTIIVANEGEVLYNFPFPQGMLTPDPHVLGAISEVLKAKPVDMREWLVASYGDRTKKDANDRANTGGVDVRSLLAPVINKDASDEEIDAAAKRVDMLLEKNKAAATNIGGIAKRIIDGGKLENYGTERSQYHLFKWARLYGTPSTEKND